MERVELHCHSYFSDQDGDIEIPSWLLLFIGGEEKRGNNEKLYAIQKKNKEKVD